MIEFGPQELAREFHSDSTHIKASRQTPITMDSLEDVRQAYLEDHPEARHFQFEESVSVNDAPTSERVSQGAYIHDRWRT